MRTSPTTILPVGLALILGCTKHHVEVQAKEPIVIKVEARIDIYNHAAAIEDMVSGKKPIQPPEEDDQSFFLLDLLVSNARAEVDITERKAIGRRRARHGRIQELKRRGIAGENSRGYLEIRSPATLAQKMLVKKENEDRKIIYRETAKAKGVPILEVQIGFADVLRQRAEPGTWIEAASGWLRK